MKYSIEWYVNDSGAQVRRLILELEAPVAIADVQRACFSVYVERRNTAGELLFVRSNPFAPAAKWARGYRTVLAAYPSDGQGNPALEGSFITLELDMADEQSRTIVGSLFASEFVDTLYRVTQVAPMGETCGLVWDQCAGIRCPQTERWTNGRCEAAQLNYGFYTPDVAGERPLVIWLHGAGEGGWDPRLAYMGNNVVNLSSPKIQAYFGGAFVLAPQCPTMWLDDGTHTYGHTGRSMYTEALKALLDEFVENHPVDRRRIYITGCSNGGFMSMRMMVDYPGFFAAGAPMCEALYDDTISDQQIAELAKTPIWMLHAMRDGIVPPEETAVPTYKRLVAAGAKNVHLTYIDDRPPMPMVGHAVWIPGLRDDPAMDFDGQPVTLEGKTVTRFQWMAAQSL